MPPVPGRRGCRPPPVGLAAKAEPGAGRPRWLSPPLRGQYGVAFGAQGHLASLGHAGLFGCKVRVRVSTLGVECESRPRGGRAPTLERGCEPRPWGSSVDPEAWVRAPTLGSSVDPGVRASTLGDERRPWDASASLDPGSALLRPNLVPAGRVRAVARPWLDPAARILVAGYPTQVRARARNQALFPS